jgi:hypothetical protein
MATNSYQAVTAGSVREDEGVAFFGKNRMAMPARSAAIVSAGGVAGPAVHNTTLDDPAIGKQTGRAKVLSNEIGVAQNVASA